MPNRREKLILVTKDWEHQKCLILSFVKLRCNWKQSCRDNDFVRDNKETDEKISSNLSTRIEQDATRKLENLRDV